MRHLHDKKLLILFFGFAYMNKVENRSISVSVGMPCKVEKRCRVEYTDQLAIMDSCLIEAVIDCQL